MRKIAILIPAWQPDQHLATLVFSLLALGFMQILIVDDGSDQLHARAIGTCLIDSRVRAMTHAVNMGKGRALKTGLNEILTAYSGLLGLVTCDADGQHLPEEILAVAKALAAAPDRLILGCRTFQGNVPWRSRFGNSLTRACFA